MGARPASVRRPALIDIGSVGGLITTAVMLVALLVVSLGASRAAADAAKPADPAEPTPTPTATLTADGARLACELATAQLRKDQPKRAAEILKLVDTTICPDVAEAIQAINDAVKPATSAAGVTPETFGKAWDDFVKAYATPLGNALLAVLGVAFALFVIARLLIETPPFGDRSSTSASRAFYGWFGWVLLALVSVGIVAAGVQTNLGGLTGPWNYALFGTLILLGGVAAVALSQWLSTMLRMKISVTGDGVTSAHIAERLRALAGNSGGRIELPGAPKIDELDKSLTSLSAVGWIAAIQKLLLFLVGVVPWDAQVELKDDRRASVAMERNGRTISVRAITTDSPRLKPLA
ncbi:MAG: hypothetical protein KIT69_19330, partial [Propionibacteriaceae bacterium]|nr:hypothetical protein [Propionibacteriaceae bacterium]